MSIIFCVVSLIFRTDVGRSRHSRKFLVLLPSHCAACRKVALLIPVAERFKARVWGRPLVGIAGSNPARGVDVCVLQ